MGTLRLRVRSNERGEHEPLTNGRIAVDGNDQVKCLRVLGLRV